MIITAQQAQQLKRLLPDESEALLASDDAMDILDALDDLYIELLDDDYEQTDASRECERLRDQIHWNNFHKE